MAKASDHGALTGAGHVRRSGGWRTGIDGALYAPADFFPGPGASAAPAVLITAPVPAAGEVVTGFGSREDRSCWLTDRSLSQPGLPLYGCLAGPECRTAREERVLAWLLRRPHGAPDPWPDLPAALFTTAVRPQILLAWRDLAARTARRDDTLADAALRSRLRRVPGWAEISDGPDGRGSSLYLFRLASTPVTRESAESAAAWLAARDKTAIAVQAFLPGTADQAAAPEPDPAADAPPTLLEAPPGPGPGGPPGPVQGRR